MHLTPLTRLRASIPHSLDLRDVMRAITLQRRTAVNTRDPLWRAVLARLHQDHPRQLPKVAFVELDHGHYALRSYHLLRNHSQRLMFMRYLNATTTARQAGLTTPQLYGSALMWHGRNPLLTIIEQKVDGVHARTYGTQEAVALATDLARWHGIDTRVFGVSPDDITAHARLKYDNALKSLARNPGVDLGAFKPLIDRVQQWVVDPAFMGIIATSHGDIHRNNQLWDSARRLCWIDLDSIKIRPTRHDLAFLTLNLLSQSADPAVVDACEQRYFELRPDESRQAWMDCRLRWFSFIIYFKAATKLDELTRRRTRQGQPLAVAASAAVQEWDVIPRLQWAQRLLSMDDQGESTWTLIRRIQASMDTDIHAIDVTDTRPTPLDRDGPQHRRGH
jgi:hypothetical protein